MSASNTTMAARIDRIPLFSMHRKLTFVVGVGTFFDLYDIFLGGVLAAVLAEEWDLGTSGKALVIASGFIGMFFGAIIGGIASDRFGRRRMFLVNLAVYSAFSLLAAASPNLGWLAVLRFAAGLGLGAELTLADTYLSEMLPRAVRGRYIAWAYTLGFVGVPVAALVGGRFVAGEDLLIDGWRWLLVVGSLGAALVWLMRRDLPESPRWHEIRGEHEAAERTISAIEDRARTELGVDRLPEPEVLQVAPAGSKRVPVGELFEEPYRRRTVMLWIFQFLQTVGYYGFGTLAPLVLADKGFDVVETLGYSAVIFLGYPLGSAASIPVMERVERKTVIVASALGMGVLGVVFGYAETPWLILTAGFLLTATSNLFSNGFHIYQAEIYPTRIRATAVGTSYSLSRASGAILPFISVSVLDGLGATAVFLGSAAIMGVLALDVGLLGPRSTGRALEEAGDEPPAAADGPTGRTNRFARDGSARDRVTTGR